MVIATTTLFPNITQADQPTLFRGSTAAQARPIHKAVEPADARWAEVRKRHIGGSSGTLRWQSPIAVSPVQPVSHTQPTVAVKPKHVASKVMVWGQDNAAAKQSPVRLVTQLAPNDPFDDPFGDHAPRFEDNDNRTFISQPEAEEIRPAEPARDPSIGETEFSPFPAAPTTPEATNDAEPETNERGFRDPVIPRSQPYQPSVACDKMYNERNCCTDAEQCLNARRRVLENTIDKISMNISPSYRPDSTTKVESDQARSLRLAESPIRSWHNRAGEVVARGQFTNVEFGRVHIEHEGQIEKIPVGQLSDDDWCFLAAWWGVPTECSLGDEQFEHRDWLASTMTWKASGVCHKPLYFEEVQLERYGHTAGPVLQPVLSGAHFFLNIATLPYQMGISPPNECEYALGYYRPGNCAPWLLPPIPLSVRGALMEAGAITGGVFVIP